MARYGAMRRYPVPVSVPVNVMRRLLAALAVVPRRSDWAIVIYVSTSGESGEERPDDGRDASTR